ncbi:MAG: hypothetical protein AAB074_03580 [Planctomycetota bacterium]
MKVIKVETLISKGVFAEGKEWGDLRASIVDAIRVMDWPAGSGKFTIRPERKGNGVKPIKDQLIAQLKKLGWTPERPLDIATVQRPGDLDAVYDTTSGPCALEWETGNISSSHRALNKMALGLLLGRLAGGVLVVPTRAFYKYLTDRVGNFEEIQPYLPLWKSIPVKRGLLEIIVVEHDATSATVAKIPKGTDGRARR